MTAGGIDATDSFIFNIETGVWKTGPSKNTACIVLSFHIIKQHFISDIPGVGALMLSTNVQYKDSFLMVGG